MRIDKINSNAVGFKAYQAQAQNISGQPSKSPSHDNRDSKARGRAVTQDPTEFSRALERAMQPR